MRFFPFPSCFVFGRFPLVFPSSPPYFSQKIQKNPEKTRTPEKTKPKEIPRPEALRLPPRDIPLAGASLFLFFGANAIYDPLLFHPQTREHARFRQKPQPRTTEGSATPSPMRLLGKSKRHALWPPRT